MYVTYRYEKDAAEKQITYSKEGYKDTRKISFFQLFKKFSVFPFFKILYNTDLSCYYRFCSAFMCNSEYDDMLWC